MNECNIMSCIICQDVPKYKCPTCREPYCSVNCFKKHKESPCESPNFAEKEEYKHSSQTTYDFPTEHTVPIEKLELLATSKDVRNCLENPNVREILQELDNSSQPDKLIQKYMQEPIFTEFVDACLKIVEPETET